MAQTATFAASALLALVAASLAATSPPEDSILLQTKPTIDDNSEAAQIQPTANVKQVVEDIAKLADPNAKTMTVHAVITMGGGSPAPAPTPMPTTPAPTPAPTPAGPPPLDPGVTLGNDISGQPCATYPCYAELLKDGQTGLECAAGSDASFKDGLKFIPEVFKAPSTKEECQNICDEHADLCPGFYFTVQNRCNLMTKSVEAWQSLKSSTGLQTWTCAGSGYTCSTEGTEIRNLWVRSHSPAGCYKRVRDAAGYPATDAAR